MKSDQEHNKKMFDLLVGKTIKSVNYLTTGDSEQLDFSRRPLLIVFEDDTMLFPVSDDEMNDGGSMIYQSKTEEKVIYTL